MAATSKKRYQTDDGLGEAEGKVLQTADTNNIAQPVTSANPLPVAIISGGGGGGGGGATTIADGADVALGTTTDSAWASGAGTVVGILKSVISSLSSVSNTIAASSFSPPIPIAGIYTAFPSAASDGTTLEALVSPYGSWVVGGLVATGSAPIVPPVSVAGVDGGGLKRHFLTDTGGVLQISQKAPTAPVTFQTKIATTLTAVNLPSNAVVKGVDVVADKANTSAIFVGGSGVTTTRDGTGNGFPLDPGASKFFPCSNTNILYINGVTVGDFVSVGEG